MRPHLTIFLTACLALAASYTLAAEDRPMEIGDIVDSDGQPLTEDELNRSIANANYLLLGETHTSAASHQWQARLLTTYADGSPVDAVVFEMITRTLQDAVDRYTGAEPQNAAGLGDAVDWEKRGWPDWELYRPIADIAIMRNIPIIGGDLSRQQTMAIGQEGTAALAPEDITAFGLDTPLAESDAATLSDILFQSHCELMPREALAPMATVQRARDGALADAMIEAGSDQPRVALIAGNGHVRRDFAVPALLEKRAPNASILAIGLLETSAEPQPFSDYGLTGANGEPLYDIVIFTGAHDDTDHCAALEERFGTATEE